MCLLMVATARLGSVGHQCVHKVVIVIVEELTQHWFIGCEVAQMIRYHCQHCKTNHAKMDP